MENEVRYCHRCEAEIPAPRVKALPETQLCVKCSEETGGEIRITAQQRNYAKGKSLKKNYGDVDVRFERKPLPIKVVRSVHEE
ncbi:MAG TPA: TraR/DksA C4-type zinc finger protein [Blastocatellia bacterium]